MKKRILIVSIIVIAIIASIAFNPVNLTNPVEECVACGTWYTCDPPRCSQTVTYWDSWRECIDYSNAMGYPGCVCYGQDLKN